MPQSTKPIAQLNSHLRVIRDEDAPAYDGAPRMEKRHMTVIDDDVVESIASTCGMSALGLYTLMERRANVDGNAFGSYQDWAELGGMTRRHVIRLMEQLVDGGWVEKEERSARNGMQRTNAWKLPFHTKPRTYRGDTDGDIGSDMAGAFVSPLKSSSKVNNDRDIDTGDSQPKPKPAPKLKETLMPDDFDLNEDRMAYAVLKGMTCAEARDLLEEMRGWSLAKGGKYLDWNAAWQNWVRRRAKDLAKQRPAANAPWVPSHV